jgi:hypothetical protein
MNRLEFSRMHSLKQIPKWQRLLDPEERRHMREDATEGHVTLAGMVRTFAYHAKIRAMESLKKPADRIEPCWTCRGIEEKLKKVGRI